MNGNGYVYTLMSVMFGLVLMAMVSLHYETYRSTSKIDTTKIRTDELHYFIESSKKDISRAMAISGRRGAIYLVDHVVSTGVPRNDPQQDLKELMMNATLTVGGVTENVTYMQNHTLHKWLAEVCSRGRTQNFDTNITFSALDIYPYDAWNILAIITLNYNVSDTRETPEACRYEDPELKIYSLIPISGLEDALYALRTANKVRRYYKQSNTTTTFNVIASGTKGNGTGGGITYDVSSSATPGPDIVRYNTTHPQLVGYTVFVMNVVDYDALSIDAKAIINSSAGVINYYDIALDGLGFPYVAGLSALPEANASYVVLKNDEEHNIVRLTINEDIAEGRYHTSNNGSSFFDRLEGRLNLSEKYVNQSIYSKTLLNSGSYTTIGLESFVNITEFYRYELYTLRVLSNHTTQSSIDHMYFQNASGVWVYGTPEWFRLDPKHLQKYNLTEFSCDPSIVLSYGFDERNGTITYDRTRNANNGRILGNAGRVAGKTRGGIGFDGVDDRINVTSSRGPAITDNLTISLWIYPASTQKPHANLISSHGAFAGYALEQTGTSDANAYSLIWDTTGAGDWVGASTYVNLSAGVWQHLAVVKSGTELLYYINGTQKTAGLASAPQISASNLSVMIGDRAGGGGHQFNGTLDEIKIWARALSAEEILYEYEKSR